MKGRCVIGSLQKIMRGRNVSIEVESFLLQTLTYKIRLGHGIGHSRQECMLWKQVIQDKHVA